MKIRFLSGPKTGEIAHVERPQDNASVALMMSAGIIEQVIDPLPPIVVRWGIAKSAHSGRFALVATCSRENCNRVYYDGPAKALKGACFAHSHADGKPEPIPADILKEYTKAKGEEVITLGEDEVSFWTEVHRKDLFRPESPFAYVGIGRRK